MSERNWQTSLHLLLLSEGGNDDDPHDPGGRTSRGITQEEYDEWRAHRSFPPRDVWQASDGDVIAIYRAAYWDACACSFLPDGVDYAIFDCAVLSGTLYAGRTLQTVVGAKRDGIIGPLTIVAAKLDPPTIIIDNVIDLHLAMMQGLKIWARYGDGWTNRAEKVRADARRLVR